MQKKEKAKVMFHSGKKKKEPLYINNHAAMHYLSDCSHSVVMEGLRKGRLLGVGEVGLLEPGRGSTWCRHISRNSTGEQACR
jgi:hypothetical protein